MGGNANAGECFDSVLPWAVGGALTGSAWTGLAGGAVGAGVGALGAYLTTPACGDGTNTPMTLMRRAVVDRFRGR